MTFDWTKPPPAPGLTFWRDQWAWLTGAMQDLHSDQGALAPVLAALEQLMTQSEELSAAVSANTAAVSAVVPAAATLIADVQRLLTLLAEGPQPDPAVAQAIADVQASTAALQNVGAELTASDATVPPAA